MLACVLVLLHVCALWSAVEWTNIEFLSLSLLAIIPDLIMLYYLFGVVVLGLGLNFVLIRAADWRESRAKKKAVMAKMAVHSEPTALPWGVASRARLDEMKSRQQRILDAKKSNSARKEGGYAGTGIGFGREDFTK